jgi:hypothetical protein
MMVPIIRVRDICSGKEHIVGFDKHDSLIEGADGGLQYYNLQNGDGTPGGYDFVFEEDGFNTYVEMVSVDEAIKFWRKAEKLQKENEEALKKMLGKDVVVMS